MPTKAASKHAAKPRKPARTHETLLIEPQRKAKAAASAKDFGAMLEASKGGAKPSTFVVDTSKPGGQTIKGLFEACGHTVVDTSSHADDVAPYLNALHGKPAKRSVQAERITRADLAIVTGRLDSHVDRIQELEARQATLNRTITDVEQQFAALQFAHDGLKTWADMTADDIAQDMQGHRLARIWRRIVAFFA